MSTRQDRILARFREQEAYMNDRVHLGIEQNRKASATITFTDAQGAPVGPVHMELRQKTSDFKFGANCFMLDEMETPEKNAEYRRLFSGLFDLATLPFYWSDLEPVQGQPRFAADSPKIYRRPAPDLCLAFCREHGIEPKLHCLNYDWWTPLWVPNDTPSVKRYLVKRFREIADRYAGSIPGMEVINEVLCSGGAGEPNIGPDRQSTWFMQDDEIIEWSFREARKVLPYTHLIINEATDNVWGPAFKRNHSAYYMQIERALAKGAPIDAIGMQFHMFYRAEDEAQRTERMYDPRTLYAVMDRYADFRLPMQVTEITIPAYTDSAEDEDLQAELLKNLYSVWFSHPNMESVIYWNLVDGYAAFAPQGDMSFGENYYRGGLVGFDMKPKKSYETLKKLIRSEWRTNTALDGNGSVTFRGFCGEYEGTVTTDRGTRNVTFRVSKNSANQIAITI